MFEKLQILYSRISKYDTWHTGVNELLKLLTIAFNILDDSYCELMMEQKLLSKLIDVRIYMCGDDLRFSLILLRVGKKKNFHRTHRKLLFHKTCFSSSLIIHCEQENQEHFLILICFFILFWDNLLDLKCDNGKNNRMAEEIIFEVNYNYKIALHRHVFFWRG